MHKRLIAIGLLLCGAGMGPACCGAVAADAIDAAAPMLAFPGAQGTAALTPGGRGGKLIRVTTLAASGPGSLLEALETDGPRIVVFEVGGVIDFKRREIAIRKPFLTIAGQTAPSPGITLIGAGLNIRTHDVVLRHLHVRPGVGSATKADSWSPDAVGTEHAYNVIVDHCSMSWAIDENLSASGERFRGQTPHEWRHNTSHDITFSNNIVAEGLSNASHPKGPHSKGSLIHDNTADILIVGNLYASNVERNPLFKGGARGAVINNVIYNPGARAIHYNLVAEEWEGHPYQNGEMALIGNVLRGGPSSPGNLTLFQFGGAGDVALYEDDNIAVSHAGKPLEKIRRAANATGRIVPLARPPLPFGVTLLAAAKVPPAVFADAGARPWDRDAVDARVVAEALDGRGKIIDSENAVGGFPQYKETRQPFDEKTWDMATMTALAPPLRTAR